MHPPSLFQLSWQLDSEALLQCVVVEGYLSVPEKVSDEHKRLCNNIPTTTI